MDNEIKVLLISNDVLPGMGLPTSAPGLRYYFLYKGLKELNINVKIAISHSVFIRKWKEEHNNFFISFPKNKDYIFYKDNLQKIIKKTSSKYVIFCNAMHGDKLSKINNVSFIYDMFAPKLLEMICESNNGFLTIDIDSYTKRKILAFQLADAFIVNGKKKVPYIYGFGLALKKDLTSLPNEIIHMAVEANFRKDNHCRNNIAIAGAQQQWTKYGPWLEELYDFLLINKDVTLHLLIPRRSEISSENNKSAKDQLIVKILHLDNVVSHGEKSYGDYIEFLHNMDLVIDVFERNVEREHAVVSRTVNAICCGIPVIHSSFTEVSDLITEYNAGWLVDEKGSNLKTILSTYHNEYQQKIEGAKKLALSEFNYKVNAQKILTLINSLE